MASTKRKLRGGPWAGQSLPFSEEWPYCEVEDTRTGKLIGRYEVREQAQKNRTIKVAEWDPTYRRNWQEHLDDLPAAERFSTLRRAILSERGLRECFLRGDGRRSGQ